MEYCRFQVNRPTLNYSVIKYLSEDALRAEGVSSPNARYDFFGYGTSVSDVFEGLSKVMVS